jgi:hypothetical protein
MGRANRSQVREAWPIVLYRKKVGRLLSVVETAELLNIFLIVLMALFLNAQVRAEFPVQILCLLINRRAFQTFDVGCAGEKDLQAL